MEIETMVMKFFCFINAICCEQTLFEETQLKIIAS